MLFTEVMVFTAEVQFELCVLLFGERRVLVISRGNPRRYLVSGKDRPSSLYLPHFLGVGGLDSASFLSSVSSFSSASFFFGPDFPFFVADCLGLATALFCSNFAFFKPGSVNSEDVPSFVSAGLSYERRKRLRSDETSGPDFILEGNCGDGCKEKVWSSGERNLVEMEVEKRSRR